MEKFTPLAKINTAAGTDGTDKFHLCEDISYMVMMKLIVLGTKFSPLAVYTQP